MLADLMAIFAVAHAATHVRGSRGRAKLETFEDTLEVGSGSA